MCSENLHKFIIPEEEIKIIKEALEFSIKTIRDAREKSHKDYPELFK